MKYLMLTGLFAVLSTPALAEEASQSVRTAADTTSHCSAMSSAAFTAAVTQITAKGATDSRLTVAKEITSESCLSLRQIKSVIALLEGERDRLAYAKYAYDHCSDPASYKTINDSFEFESSIDELDEYISGR